METQRTLTATKQKVSGTEIQVKTVIKDTDVIHENLKSFIEGINLIDDVFIQITISSQKHNNMTKAKVKEGDLVQITNDINKLTKVGIKEVHASKLIGVKSTVNKIFTYNEGGQLFTIKDDEIKFMFSVNELE